ncbi:MAG: TraR/DksA family transcriptional regulator [Planctomycetota bacterium]|nr:MAG: TraR/DksA family transcriptional regulator [Planctomycetota bacterium]
MKKAEAKQFKERLLLLRARLRGDVNAMADAALRKTRSEANGDLSSMPIHMADIGSDNYEQEFTLSLMQSEEGTLESIEAAIEKVEDGTYGICEECGGNIPKARLNAIPYTPVCIKCAQQLEGS